MRILTTGSRCRASSQVVTIASVMPSFPIKSEGFMAMAIPRSSLRRAEESCESFGGVFIFDAKDMEAFGQCKDWVCGLWRTH